MNRIENLNGSWCIFSPFCPNPHSSFQIWAQKENHFHTSKVFLISIVFNLYIIFLQSLGLCPKGGQPKTQNFLRNFHSLFIILHFGPFLKFSWHFLTTGHLCSNLLSKADRVSTYVLIMCPDWKKNQPTNNCKCCSYSCGHTFLHCQVGFSFFSELMSNSSWGKASWGFKKLMNMLL